MTAVLKHPLMDKVVGLACMMGAVVMGDVPLAVLGAAFFIGSEVRMLREGRTP